MRLKKLFLEEIQYEICDYSQTLYDSIIRMGFSFPIKIKIIDNQYYCTDGHKRLSALQKIYEENQREIMSITCMVMNDGSSRSDDCWRSRNTH